MSKRSRYSANEKYNIIQEYNSGALSTSDISHRYGVVDGTLRHWIYLYKKYGVLGLKESKTWKNYSKELKTNAVLEYRLNPIK
ncbi:transposase [Tepidibacter mesophilus]|uniref:transposase n=1 Tax=Tepidibacter mesophilus TaxID=655607 RepID=UPI000C086AC6|nr:transposase [Tepidibacter mesophilus]